MASSVGTCLGLGIGTGAKKNTLNIDGSIVYIINYSIVRHVSGLVISITKMQPPAPSTLKRRHKTQIHLASIYDQRAAPSHTRTHG